MVSSNYSSMAASPKRSWSLSTLPPEILEVILHRTQAESLVLSKATCKQWYSLIKNKRFIYQHLALSQERFLRTDKTVQILDLVKRTRSDSPIPAHDFQPNILALVHCDGLMLCMWSTQISSFAKLSLWNPLTRNINFVKPSPTQRQFRVYDTYGIGYVLNEPPRRDYKILKLSPVEHNVEIYDCNSKSWKTLLDDAKVDRYVHRHCNGVSLNGNMYWLGRRKPKSYILGFDFSDETFKDICLCPCDSHLPYEDNYLAGFSGDCLSLLEQNQEKPSPITVWVSSKLANGNVSFAKYFTVDIPELPALHSIKYRPHPVYLIANKCIIALCARAPTGLVLYEVDHEAGIINQRETARDYMDDYAGISFCGYVYVPSLVPLPC